ncbi:MAG: hypothetical protein FJ035_06015 [Chloroflexi bacterium]|nr:hypothetical protein [Chloroflexota bacterium]
MRRGGWCGWARRAATTTSTRRSRSCAQSSWRSTHRLGCRKGAAARSATARARASASCARWTAGSRRRGIACTRRCSRRWWGCRCAARGCGRGWTRRGCRCWRCFRA